MPSIIIPANNEEAYLGRTLDALIASGPWPGVEIIVAANACMDRTVAVAEARRGAVEARGWTLQVLDLPEGGKARALNAADAVAGHPARIYLDADVWAEPGLVPALAAELARPGALYASGEMKVRPPQDPVSRAYGRIWTRLPFMTDGVQGCGCFAVSAEGRRRWQGFPEIISDDTFVRLLFTAEERRFVAAAFSWPLPEGFRNLVRVRRRADAGLEEIRALYPGLFANEAKPRPGPGSYLRLFAAMPVSFCLYAAVLLTVRLTRGQRRGWDRGR